MSKKQNSKNKLSIKLSIGETAIVIDYETAMHIAETYDYLASENEDEYAESFRRVADTVRMQAMENHFDSIDDDYEEW